MRIKKISGMLAISVVLHLTIIFIAGLRWETQQQPFEDIVALEVLLAL